MTRMLDVLDVLDVTKIHCTLDVEGWLTRFAWSTKAEKKRIVVGMTDGGRDLTPDEAYSAMLGELAQGRRRLPIGKPCEGFSYETGCPRHPSSRAEVSAALQTPRGE